MPRRARRSFTPEFKAQVVLDLLGGERSQAELCRLHQLSTSLLVLWKDAFLERLPLVFQADEQRGQERQRIADLEQLVGRQALELEILKKSLQAHEWTGQRRREVVMSLTQHYPARLVCRLLDFPRCQLYRALGDAGAEDAPLREALTRLAGEWPTYGYRRLTAMLRREGWAVNGKRVRRVMAAMGFHGAAPVRRKRTTDSNHDFPRWPNLVETLAVVRPDQVWVADITYIRLRRDFVYLAVVMDVFTRLIRGWHLGRGLDGGLTLTALERALAHGRPEIHHSDQGVQYAADDYVQRLLGVGTQVSMAAVGEPRENGFAERLMRTIKEEEVDLSEYLDYADALRQLGRFLDAVYNHKRIHSALGYLTPAEFEQQWRETQPA